MKDRVCLTIDPGLLKSIKEQAALEERSVSSFVERTLRKATAPLATCAQSPPKGSGQAA